MPGPGNSALTSCAATFRNAWDFYTPADEMYMVTTRLSHVFEELVEEFKTRQLSSAQKAFSNATAKPNSMVAALLDKRA